MKNTFSFPQMFPITVFWGSNATSCLETHAFAATRWLKLKEIWLSFFIVMRVLSLCEEGPQACLVYVFASRCRSPVNTQLVFHPSVKCQSCKCAAGLWFPSTSRSRVRQDGALRVGIFRAQRQGLNAAFLA